MNARQKAKKAIQMSHIYINKGPNKEQSLDVNILPCSYKFWQEKSGDVRRILRR